MRKVLATFFVFCVATLATFLLVSGSKNNKVEPIVVERPRAILGSTEIDIEIANTPETRERGLSGRESIAKNRGMLFAFKKPDIYCFWMKDMKFSIDILWLRDDGTVTQIAENAMPTAQPERICPKEAGRYVLEVASGVAKETDVIPGSVVQIVK